MPQSFNPLDGQLLKVVSAKLRELREENGAIFQIFYELLLSAPDVYSLHLAKTEGELITEDWLFYDFSRDASFAQSTFSALWQGAVTPCTVRDVVADLLSA